MENNLEIGDTDEINILKASGISPIIELAIIGQCCSFLAYGDSLWNISLKFGDTVSSGY